MGNYNRINRTVPGLPLMVGNIAYFVISFSDRFFIEHYSGLKELGLYSFGCKFAGLTNAFMLGPFFLAWNPMRWHIYELDNGKEIFARFNILLLILVPVFCLCIISVAVVLGAVMTVDKTFIIGFQIMPMIAFCHVFYGLFYFNQMGMLFEKKTRIIMRIIIAAGVMNLILNYLLIPAYGMLGASVATICSYLLMFIAGGCFSQRYYTIERNLSFETFQIILFLIYVFVLTWLYYQNRSIIVMAVVPLCMAVFHIIMSLLGSSVFRREAHAVVAKIRVKRSGKS